MKPPARRATDAERIPPADRARWRASRLAPLARLAWGTTVIVIAVIAIATSSSTSERSDDRDAARAYQRCEQFVPPTTVLSAALDRFPRLAAEVDREHPGLLTRGTDGRLHLDVPDCRRIYPHGARVSPRFPDLTPTRPTP